MNPGTGPFLAGRRLVVVTVAVAVLILAVCWPAAVAVGDRLTVLHGQAVVLESELATARNELAQVRTELAAVTRERDEKAWQLAPFEGVAAVQVGSAPYEKRLAILLERVEALAGAGAEAQGRRHLDAEALARLRATLQDAPHIDVEVGGVLNDPESMNLAQELRSVFAEAHFKTRRLAEYMRPPNGFHGVSIYSKHELDQVLAAAVSQLFTELSQPAVQWVEEENIAAARAGEPPPDLKIIVGSQ